VRNHAHPHARNVAAYGEGAIVGDRSFGKCQMHRAMNILVSSATVHLKKNCCQISGPWQANLAQACRAANSAAAQQEICFRGLRRSASLPASTTLMEVRRVDLRSKLNVLAVCAVFVFVGAILLGAF
jgi:hypothetical protein